MLIGQPCAYDTMTRTLLRPLFGGIAADVTASSPVGARVLEIGCGPGHLSIRLAQHGLEVTGVDLDPVMIERAEANAARAGDAGVRPSLLEMPLRSRSPMPRTTSSSAPSQFITGPTQRPASPRSGACCGLVDER